MRHVDLTVFENHTIMHEKAVSLPVGGKVSFRQLGILTVGVLAAFVAFFITKDFIVPGAVLATALGFGIPNTKIMTPDQILRALLVFLVRGTSLTNAKPASKMRRIKKTDSKPANVKAENDNKYKKKSDKKLKQLEILAHETDQKTSPSSYSPPKLNTVKLVMTADRLDVTSDDMNDPNSNIQFILYDKDGVTPVKDLGAEQPATIFLDEQKLGDYKTDKNGNMNLLFAPEARKIKKTLH